MTKTKQTINQKRSSMEKPVGKRVARKESKGPKVLIAAQPKRKLVVKKEKQENKLKDIEKGDVKSSKAVQSKIVHLKRNLEENISKQEDIKNETKKKNVKEIVKSDPETKNSPSILELSEPKVLKAIEVTFEMIKKREEKKGNKVILLDDEVPIFLQIECVKVPKCPLRTLRFTLPHSLLSENADICLIVSDLKRGRKVDPQPAIDHYEGLLSAAGITNVTVIPFTQLKLEYSQYEAKRKLLGLYDVFLVDGKLSGHVFHLLGKIFTKARKLPISVRLGPKFNIKHELHKALQKTSIVLTPHGNTTITKIGHSKMNPEHIAENILVATKWLSNNYPGGCENIQFLQIKTPCTGSIPLFVSMKSCNEVKVPVVLSRKMSLSKNVEGELTTILGASVRVDVDGKVHVKKEMLEGMSDNEKPKTKILKRKASNQQSPSKKVQITAKDDDDDDECDKEENKEEIKLDNLSDEEVGWSVRNPNKKNEIKSEMPSKAMPSKKFARKLKNKMLGQKSNKAKISKKNNAVEKKFKTKNKKTAE